MPNKKRSKNVDSLHTECGKLRSADRNYKYTKDDVQSRKKHTASEMS